MYKEQSVILVVGNAKFKDLTLSIEGVLHSAFKRVTPITACIDGRRSIAVQQGVTPDLVIICNWDLNYFTAYEVVKQFPDTKFIILVDAAIRSQAEVTGARLVEKPCNLKTDLIPEVVDLLTQ